MTRKIKHRLGRLLNQAVNVWPVGGVTYDVSSEVYFPIPQPDDTVEKRKLATGWRRTFFCNVCGKRSMLRVGGAASLREIIACLNCRAIGRHRQLAAVILAGTGLKSLAELGRSGRKLRVYNTEAAGSLHEALKNLPNYTCSEYFEGKYKGGDIVDGVRHQDLQKTTFKPNSFDLVISSDVFEHIPEPYRAHTEVWRILAPGGRHVMSVPFQFDGYQDNVLAEQRRNGQVKHLKKPVYHHDSLRPEGVLTFRIFGLESLVRLTEIGYEVNFYNLHRPKLGIFGRHAFIFELLKPRPRKPKQQ